MPEEHDDRRAGKLGRSKLGRETLSDPQTFAAYIGLLFGPNCN